MIFAKKKKKIHILDIGNWVFFTKKKLFFENVANSFEENP
jgi:hypothetical protein